MKNVGKTKQVFPDKIAVAELSIGLFYLFYGFSMFGKIKVLLATSVLIDLGTGMLFETAYFSFKYLPF